MIVHERVGVRLKPPEVVGVQELAVRLDDPRPLPLSGLLRLLLAEADLRVEDGERRGGGDVPERAGEKRGEAYAEVGDEGVHPRLALELREGGERAEGMEGDMMAICLLWRAAELGWQGGEG